MSQNAGDDSPAIPGVNEAPPVERQGSEEQLLARILRDDVAGLSGCDKARALIASNGDLGHVLRAEPHRLRVVVPLSNEDLSLLNILRRAAGLASKNEVLSRPVIGSLSALEAYLRSALGADVSLELRALLLDQRNRLQADVALKHHPGQDATTAARDLIRIALEHGASAAIVVQGGRRDANCFETALIDRAKIVERSLQAVGIVLHDYVRRNHLGCASMRASGFLC
jgi:DNA repair protein RadC